VLGGPAGAERSEHPRSSIGETYGGIKAEVLWGETKAFVESSDLQMLPRL
jgi:hypothetical protein